MNKILLDILCAVVTIPLLPILFGQGMSVRKHTPRLPEAGGAVAGWEPGSRPPINLITLGESTVAGVGAATHQKALTGQIATALARQTEQKVGWLAVGQNGMTAQKARLELVPRLANKKADFIVIALGVNDTLHLHSPTRWGRDLEHLLDAVWQHLGPIPIILAGMPPVGQFPAFPQPLGAIMGFRAKMLDQVTRQVAKKWSTVIYCPIPLVHGNSGFAADGFHPGPLGYAIWGHHLAQSIIDLVSRQN